MDNFEELFRPFDVEFFICQWKDCHEKFDEFAYFFGHLRREHSGDFQNIETICGWDGCEQSGFESIDQLYTHMTVHAYYYRIMSEGFKVLKNIGFDKAMCKQDSTFRCDISGFPTTEFICAWKDCNGSFNDYNLFVQHIGCHAIEDVTIPLIAKEKLRKIRYAQCCWLNCGKDFKTKTHLKTHLLSHSFGKNYACPVCGLGFVNKAQFLNHCYRQKVSISVEKNSSKKRKNIEDSDVKSKQESEEIKNQKIDEDSVSDDRLSCPHCPKIFPSQQLYQQHVARHERKHPCPDCDYVAPFPSNLRAHIRYKHTKERNFACKFCPASFKSNSDLLRHVHLHSNPQANNICDICGKSYTTSYSLNRHRAEHAHSSGALFKFKCEVCQAGFDNLETITDHLKTEHSNFSLPTAQ